MLFCQSRGSRKDLSLASKRSTLIAVSLLSLLAVSGNVFSATISYGVDFLFGSVFTLLSIRMFGLLSGVAVGAIGGATTYFLWGHPYAFIIFTLEALVVGLIKRYWIYNLVIADILYWLLLGVPLVWLFYSQVLGLDWAATEIIMLKQPINGINNAILASLVVSFVSTTCMKSWLPQGTSLGSIAIRELTFILLLFISYATFLSLLIYNNNKVMQNRLSELERDLQGEVRHVAHILALEPGKGSRELLDYYMEEDQHRDRIINLYDKQSSIIDSTENPSREDLFVGGHIEPVEGQMYLWLPEQGKLPRMKWHYLGIYYVDYEVNLGEVTRIRIMQPTPAVVASMHQSQKDSLYVLVLFSIFTSFVAYFISGIFSKPIQLLSQVTGNLPQRIRESQTLEWPVSSIKELQELSDNGATMSTSLKEYFLQMLDTQANLEQHVHERTESLKESSARYKAIIDNTVVGMISINEQGTIESFNSAAEDILQYSADEVLGQNINILMPEPYHSEHDSYLLRYIKTGEKRIIGTGREVTARRKDGSVIDIDLSVSEVPLSHGRIFIGIISDITQRKHAENIKNDFIANISHELRTPLTAIRGAIGILGSGVLGELPEKGKNMLDITIDNSERLIRLINDLLDLQKLETGADNFVMGDIEVMPVVEACLAQNEPYVMEFGCQLNVSGDLGHIKAHINADKLNQVLTNLISNAAKFSPTDGIIAVQLDADEQHIHISISDQGQGVPREFWDTMFDKFSQVESVVEKKARGTGLGLSISKTLLERMSGDIQVVSIEGRGTTFIVTLPVARIV